MADEKQVESEAEAGTVFVPKGIVSCDTGMDSVNIVAIVPKRTVSCETGIAQKKDEDLDGRPLKSARRKSGPQQRTLVFDGAPIRSQLYYLDAVSDGAEKLFLIERKNDELERGVCEISRKQTLKEQFINYNQALNNSAVETSKMWIDISVSARRAQIAIIIGTLFIVSVIGIAFVMMD